MTTWITVCDTCKRPEWDVESGITDGEIFAEKIEAAVLEKDTAVRVRRHSCLMGCVRACNVTVQGSGKMAYSLGEFQPTDDDADAVATYAGLHADSETGVVPYRTWPQGVKGHFVSRHLPLPDA